MVQRSRWGLFDGHSSGKVRAQKQLSSQNRARWVPSRGQQRGIQWAQGQPLPSPFTPCPKGSPNEQWPPAPPHAGLRRALCPQFPSMILNRGGSTFSPFRERQNPAWNTEMRGPGTSSLRLDSVFSMPGPGFHLVLVRELDPRTAKTQCSQIRR